MMEWPGAIAWGTPGGGAGIGLTKPFNGEAATIGNGVMVALEAKDKEQIHRLHEIALANGGTCDGPPGPRSSLEPTLGADWARPLFRGCGAPRCPSSWARAVAALAWAALAPGRQPAFRFLATLAGFALAGWTDMPRAVAPTRVMSARVAPVRRNKDRIDPRAGRCGSNIVLFSLSR